MVNPREAPNAWLVAGPVATKMGKLDKLGKLGKLGTFSTRRGRFSRRGGGACVAVHRLAHM